MKNLKIAGVALGAIGLLAAVFLWLRTRAPSDETRPFRAASEVCLTDLPFPSAASCEAGAPGLPDPLPSETWLSS